MMNITNEIIEAKRADIMAAMEEADRKAYRHPTCEYRVYIDSDGEIGDEEWVANDNARNEFRGDYSRTYLHTFCHQNYSILWDYWFIGIGEFKLAFAERFGVEIGDSDDYDGMSMEETGKAVAAEHGNSADEYYSWLEEAEKDAIDDVVGNTDYDGILDESLEEMERDEKFWEEYDR